MSLAAKGHDDAFSELYRRYARRLQGFFYRQTGGDIEQSADMSQEVFLHVFSARKTFDEKCNFASWLFTIAYNLCRNAFRSSIIQKQFAENFASKYEDSELPDVEIKMDQETLDYALRKVLGELSADARLLFSLRYEEELSIPQIAQIAIMPEGTVKSRLHRIMKIIKLKLVRYEKEHN
jgi:RNA polymerase sigma-70 factor (ECF subfamily)